MRAIDANRLIEEWGYADGYSGKGVVCIEDIETAPTITYEDLVPHGRWVWYDHTISYSYINRGYMCSVCGSKQEDKTNYCPNCGAKMDK